MEMETEPEGEPPASGSTVAAWSLHGEAEAPVAHVYSRVPWLYCGLRAHRGQGRQRDQALHRR